MQTELTYIYGRHAVMDALTQRPELIRELYLGVDVTDVQLEKKLRQAKIEPRRLREDRLPGGLPRSAVHQGFVAGIDAAQLLQPYKQFIANKEFTPDTCFLILGEVQDPHNVGAVIRSAAAFGVTAVLIPPHKQAQLTGTVVKVSAGTVFRIPVVAISNVNATIRDLQQRGAWVYGLVGDGDVSLVEERFDRPAAFVLGNEGSGLREKTAAACDQLLAIPIHQRCESLNASVAAAVVMSTWSQQHPGALTN